MDKESFIFEIERNWNLDFNLTIPSKLIDHLLLPFYGLITFLSCLIIFIPYTIFYLIKKCRKQRNGGKE